MGDTVESINLDSEESEIPWSRARQGATRFGAQVNTLASVANYLSSSG